MNRSKKLRDKATFFIKRNGIVVAMMTMAAVSTFRVGTGITSSVVQAASTNLSENKAPSISVKQRTATTAKISIQKVNGATSYEVYRSTSRNGNYTYIGSTQNGTYKDRGLKAKNVYYYKVKSVYGNTKSSYSNILKLEKTLSKVGNVIVTSSSGKIALQWNPVNDAQTYNIYRSNLQNGTYQFIGSTYTSTYADYSVEQGKTYYYKVRAQKNVSNVSYHGVYSNVVSGTWNQVNNSKPNYVNEVLRLVNIERKKEGLSELTATDALKKAANQRAIEIKSVFSHSRPDGSSCFTVLGEYSVSYRTAGENIAYGQRTPQEVVQGWMNSEGHRANILNSNFGKLGVGCYESNGVLYWTQLFIS